MTAHLDALVLTAANPAQARGYRAHLEARRREGMLDGVARALVVADPEGRRVGSGTATLLALAAAAGGEDLPAFLARSRVLIVHSGGDSRRLPAYAALGKAFVPLPVRDVEGRPLAMLDLILLDLRGFVERASPGRVFIASGDVYLGLSGQPLDLDRPGLTAVAFRAGMSTASRHGVFVAGARGLARTILQKPTAGQARAAHAIARDGSLLVDAGLIAMDAGSAWRLARAMGLRRGGSLSPALQRVCAGVEPGIDLYAHVLPALAARPPRGLSIAAAGARATGLRVRVEVADRCEFMHVGTTAQFDAITRTISRTRLPPGCRPDSGALPPIDLAPGTATRRRSLPPGVGLVSLPIGPRGWAVIAYGQRDDGKTLASAGGTLANRPLRDWPGTWTSGAPRDAWHARAWVVGDLRRSARAAIALARGSPLRNEPRRRHPLAEVLPRVNHARLLGLLDQAHRARSLADLTTIVRRSPWLSATRLAGWPLTKGEARGALRLVLGVADRAGDPLVRARCSRAARALCRRWGLGGAAKHEQAAFAQVARIVGSSAAKPRRRPKAGIRSDEVVWVTCPVRLDLSGGWSDTPPLCHEFGGAVVNAAVTLNGQYPIQVVCRRSDRPGIRLSSIDLGRSRVIRTAEDVRRPLDPGHWAALPSAALFLSGFAPPRDGPSLTEWLTPLGGGLELTFFSAVPKGSGLGTSSIFGAAMLAALARAAGESVSRDALIARTSQLEQHLTTGGGWQDQAGGITPGVKLLLTKPGLAQRVEARALQADWLGGAAAQSRLLLYYTGMRRLARNILRTVVGRYLDRDPQVRHIVEQLKAGAHRCAHALADRDLDGFGHCLTRYWDLKKRIDPGSTNARIESLIGRVAPHLSGYTLAGAGAGGFLFMVARSGSHAETVRQALTRAPSAAAARFFEVGIDGGGLHVTTL